MKCVSVAFLYVFHYAERSSNCIDNDSVDFFSSVKHHVLTVTLEVCIKKKEVQVLITKVLVEK